MEARARAAIAKLQDATQHRWRRSRHQCPKKPTPSAARCCWRSERPTPPSPRLAPRQPRSPPRPRSTPSRSRREPRLRLRRSRRSRAPRRSPSSIRPTRRRRDWSRMPAPRPGAPRTTSSCEPSGRCTHCWLGAKRCCPMSTRSKSSPHASAIDCARSRRRCSSWPTARPGWQPLFVPICAAGSELPAPTSNGVVSSGGATEPMPPPVSEPFITGQIPIVGAQPLVSPMPSSNEEARSMWHEAELADAAALAGDDTVPMESGASDYGHRRHRRDSPRRRRVHARRGPSDRRRRAQLTPAPPANHGRRASFVTIV